MKDKIKSLQEQLQDKIKEVKTLKQLNDLKTEYLGKKGCVTALTANMKD